VNENGTGEDGTAGVSANSIDGNDPPRLRVNIAVGGRGGNGSPSEALAKGGNGAQGGDATASAPACSTSIAVSGSGGDGAEFGGKGASHGAADAHPPGAANDPDDAHEANGTAGKDEGVPRKKDK